MKIVKSLNALFVLFILSQRFCAYASLNLRDFTELLHTKNHGQVFVDISRPGITKGEPWYNSKWEQFIVVSDHGRFEERNINTEKK